MTPLLAFIAYCVAFPSPISQQSSDIVIADFEGTTYAPWTTTGTAFGPGPAQGTLPGQMAVGGYKGKGLVNSYYGGDGSTGTLASPTFKIERGYIAFLIGGGKDPLKTCMNLLVEGKVVRTSTGPNDQPGGSENLAPDSWDVREFVGKTAVIQIVDQATGGWGHINVDHILLTNRKPPSIIMNSSRTITLTSPYLNLPVKTAGPKRQMTVAIEGQPPRSFDIELADGKPDWWAFMDIGPFKGSKATITVDKLSDDSMGLKSIDQSNQIKGAETLYREKFRPQFHFSPRRGWNNDPNGLVFHDGEYHLFFQHNPYGWGWGNMHWGHAVSSDLMHWHELPVALYPDSHGTMFSGSAVVDETNSAGFQTGKEKAMVTIFTAAGKPFTQGIAYSNDRGRTWTKFEGNPVLSHIEGENRDPKVIWYAPEKKWVMALYLDGNDYALFTSKNLKHWEKMSDVHLANASECPEFFEIPVEGQRGETRWVFYGGNGLYSIGKFDGTTFTSESGPHTMHHGNNWYASQTYNGIPKQDGRRILIPWATQETRDMPFNQMMGTPVELTLHQTDEGLRLFAVPVRELVGLRKKEQIVAAQTIHPGENPLHQLHGELIDMTVEIRCGDASELNFNLRGTIVHYNVAQQELTCGDSKAALKTANGIVQLRFLVDRTSLDIFGQNGQVYMPRGAIAPHENHSLGISVTGGNAELVSCHVYELKSAWEGAK